MKTVQLFLLFLLFHTYVYSQETKVKNEELSKGVVLGLGFSDLSSNNLLLTQANPSLSFNINARFSLQKTEVFGITMEPGFIRKGYSFNGYVGNIKIQFNYVQLPILIDLSPSEKITLFVGPEVGYLLSAQSKSGGTSSEITANYNRIELSGIVGVRYQVAENIDIGLRVNRGITTTQTIQLYNAIGVASEQLRYYNQYIQGTFGFTF